MLSENLEENESTWIVIYRPVSGYEFRLSSRRTPRRRSSSVRRLPSAPVSPRALGPAPPPSSRTRSAQWHSLANPASAPSRCWRARSCDRATASSFEHGWRIAIASCGSTGTGVLHRARRSDAHSGREQRQGASRRSPAPHRAWTTDGARSHGYAAATISSIAFGRRGPPTWCSTCWTTGSTREHLIDAGFLRARIEVEVDRPDSDTDRARVRIDPGLRTGSRQLAFRGNQVLATQTLQELTASGRLDANAWKDPAPLIAAIREAYAAKGYLAARVTIGPIEFADDGDVADSDRRGAGGAGGGGPADGRCARAAVWSARGDRLAVGSPFAAGADRSGRARLERYYRDLGFRDVHVESTATAASQGMDMALTFAVNEGPLHVISSVEIEGVQSTRPSLVSKAVQLTPGEPAGAAAAAATEKRLYELGTFRRAVRLEPAPALGPVQGVLPVKAIVSLEEARRFQLRYGLELSSEYASALDQRTNALGAAADIRDRNFLGRGMSLEGACVTNPTCGSASAVPTRGARYEPTCS